MKDQTVHEDRKVNLENLDPEEWLALGQTDPLDPLVLEDFRVDLAKWASLVLLELEGPQGLEELLAPEEPLECWGTLSCVPTPVQLVPLAILACLA